MKHEGVLSLSIAVAAFTLLLPQIAQAKSMNSTQHASASAAHEARLMVPARASLETSIDSGKLQAGNEFRATLEKNVRLKNGAELPKGTQLIGKAVADATPAGGSSQLVLQITKASLKSGKVVPIKATIMGVSQPNYDNYGETGGSGLLAWNGTTLQMDQLDVVSGADLHSKIAGKDSAVIVSSNHQNIRLAKGSEMILAIGPGLSSRS
ncbi:MAG TPA: hypothetical protein VFI20_11430 [Terracidiphilus sp.]|nr:hypothetical protein [Terracidiphilus sp.]